jgi:hypothetical protein
MLYKLEKQEKQQYRKNYIFLCCSKISGWKAIESLRRKAYLTYVSATKNENTK